MRVRRAFTVLSVASLCLPVLAMAAGHEAAAGTGEAHAELDWGGLGLAFVNFVIFLEVIRRFAWPAVRDFLKGRRRELVEAMSAAARAMAEAEEIRREYAMKEAALDETRRRMVEEIRESAAADRQRALEAARVTGERLRADAERQAASEIARARRELRAEAARLAAQLAEAQIREKLGPADRSKLVQEFVAGVAQQ